MSWQSCPKCGFNLISTIDTRWKPDIPGVYRRHWCLNKKCQHRFTTVEKVVKTNNRWGNIGKQNE